MALGALRNIRLGVRTALMLAASADVLRNSDQEVRNHADRKNSVFAGLNEHNQSDHDGEGAECAD